jgi:hypothetical protein
MAATRMKLQSLVSVGALALLTACGPATADVPRPADEEIETPEGADGGTEAEEDLPGGKYLPDCRTRGSEMVPC